MKNSTFTTALGITLFGIELDCIIRPISWFEDETEMGVDIVTVEEVSILVHTSKGDRVPSPALHDRLERIILNDAVLSEQVNVALCEHLDSLDENERERYTAMAEDYEEHDGQPTEYEEWQDYMGGDDRYDYSGDIDSCCDCDW